MRVWIALTGLLLLSAGTVFAATRDTEPPPKAERIVDQALAQAGSIPNQADALARLAWPDHPGDPKVAEVARDRLVHFGERAYPAYLKAIPTARKDQVADITRAVLESRKLKLAGSPPAFLRALDAAVWFGNRDARLMAIPQLALYRFNPSLLNIMDAGVEDAKLLPLVVNSLGSIGDDRARFFLERILREGPEDLRPRAAAAMAAIGGRALLPLKTGVLDPDPKIRLACVRALLPVAGPGDLTTLYEYLSTFAEDDPDVVKAVRKTAVTLERLLDAVQKSGSAGSGPDS